MNINNQSLSVNQQNLLEKRHHYSSSQGPFHNANSLLMFYGGGGRSEVLESLARSLKLGDRILTVNGERGSGKTMMSLVLSNRLKHDYNIIRYDLPKLTPELMLRHLLIEIRPQDAAIIKPDAAQPLSPRALKAGVQRLLSALQSRAQPSKPYLLIIDSPAELDVATLKLLNDLVSSQAKGETLIQIVLFRRTEAPRNRSVCQREERNAFNGVDDHYHLRRLSLNEVNEYLRHHMMLFDFNQRDAFTREMAYFIADRSAGVFRGINTLARNAFMLASIEDANKVSMSHLFSAGSPLREPEVSKPHFVFKHRGLLIATLGFSILMTLATVVFLNT